MREPTWQAHCADFAVRQLPWRQEKRVRTAIGKMPRSAAEQAELYRRFEVRDLQGLVTKLLGEPISPLKAMRGDLVMVDNALGICRGELAEFVDGMQPMHRATCAWSTHRRKFG